MQVYIDNMKQKVEDLEKELRWVHKDLDEKEDEERLVEREGKEALEAAKIDHKLEMERLKEEHLTEI